MSKEINRSKVLIALHAAKKLEAEARRLLELLPQGHGSGLNADMVDDLHVDEIIELARKSIVIKAGGSGGGQLHAKTTSFTELTDTIANGQTPNTLLLSGLRPMTGDLDIGVGNKIIIDGTKGISCPDENLGILFHTDGSVRIVGSNLAASPMKDFRCNNFYSIIWFGGADPAYLRTTSGWGGGRKVHLQGFTAGWASTAATLFGETASGTGDDRFAIPRAGDIKLLDAKFLTFDKASGNGIKVDTGTPTFGWRDLLGQIRTRGVGATDPNDATYNGNIKAYKFSVNDEFWIDYHIPHDYVKGTDIFIHWHWSHNNAFVTGGNVTWGADITYAKGHNQAPFPASVNTTVLENASTTQYQHMIIEVQISTSGGGAGQIDTDALEPDGVIMIRGYLSANNITVSEGAVPEPFLHFADIHYQSTNIGTKDKAPDFYA